MHTKAGLKFYDVNKKAKTMPRRTEIPTTITLQFQGLQLLRD